MPFTKSQRQARLLAKRVTPVLVLGVLLGFAGPFSAYPPLGAPIRFGFWIGMVIAGYLAALAAEKLLRDSAITRPALRTGAIALASAVPLTFVAAWIVPLLRPGHAYQPLQLPALFGAVAAVQLAIVFTLLREHARPSPPAEQDCETPAALPNPLLARLPVHLGQDIVALEAEDHYLRVYTALGSDLILMRLSDAIAAMGPDAGRQVHRSWWVADAAIREIVRSDQRTHLRLSQGLLVPVGRTYSSVVRSFAARGSATGEARSATVTRTAAH